MSRVCLNKQIKTKRIPKELRNNIACCVTWGISIKDSSKMSARETGVQRLNCPIKTGYQDWRQSLRKQKIYKIISLSFSLVEMSEKVKKQLKVVFQKSDMKYYVQFTLGKCEHPAVRLTTCSLVTET